MAIKKCQICNSKEIFARFPFDQSHTIFSCKSCKVDFLDPRPSSIELSKATDNSYFSFFADEEIKKSKLASFNRAVEISKVCLSGNILEVGTGKAFITENLRENNKIAWGIEKEKSIWSQINRRCRNFVRLGDFEKSTWKKKFDLMIMFDLIEHLSNPKAALNKANSILYSGGKIIIITPNQNSWKRILLGRRWSAYYLEHSFIFHPVTIRLLADQTGFQVCAIRKFYKNVTWRYFFSALYHRYPFPIWKFLARINLKFEITIDDDSMLIVLRKK